MLENNDNKSYLVSDEAFCIHLPLRERKRTRRGEDNETNLAS